MTPYRKDISSSSFVMSVNGSRVALDKIGCCNRHKEKKVVSKM